MGVYSKYRKVNTVFGGDDGIVVPNGTTAQRPSVPVTGTLRYNTTIGLLENFNANGWAAIDVPPIVTNVAGTINENTSSTITITGNNFKAGCIISIEGPAVSNLSRTLTTTFVSTTQLTANTNASSVTFVGGAAFDVKVTNPSGLAGSLTNAGLIDRDPVWSTGAGSLGTVTNANRSSTSFTLSASDPDGGTVTYTLVSGALPPGGSLTTGGVINGPFNGVGSATTSTFTIRATSSVGGQLADRTFSITINPPVEVQFRNEGASANTSNWNNGSTFNMAQFGGLGNVTAHGGVTGPVTFTLSLTGLPTHTDIRYQVFWHMVDSLDNETSSFYTSDTNNNNVLRARWTKVYNNTPQYSTLNITGTWSGGQPYTYRPWGNGSFGQDGYAAFDTGFYTHTSSSFTAIHEMGYDQGITDEAMYLSHVVVWLRQ
jgi:hypothetical protein